MPLPPETAASVPPHPPGHGWTGKEWVLWFAFATLVIAAGLLLLAALERDPAPAPLPPATLPEKPSAPPAPTLDDVLALIAATPPAAVDPAWDATKPHPRWRRLIIHHTATRGATPAALDRYHRRTRKMENGLAYHFVIGNGSPGFADGAVHVGERWTRQLDGGHVRDPALNREAIGICLVGHLDEQAPTAAQIASLKALIHFLMEKTGIAEDAIVGHGEAPGAATACPGKLLPVKTIVTARQSPAPPPTAP